jgi:acyl carrier protein
MAGDAERQRLERRGLRGLDAQRALDALEWVMSGDEPNAVIVDVDWVTFRESYEAWGPRPLLTQVASKPGDPTGAETGLDPRLAALRDQSPSAREEQLRLWLVEQCTIVMRNPEGSELDFRRGFFDLGMDSLMTVELRRRVERALGLRLPAGITFDHPNVDALAAYLSARLAPEEERPHSPKGTPAAAALTEGDAAQMSMDDMVKFIDSAFDEVEPE